MTLARLYTLCSDLLKHGTPGNTEVYAFDPNIMEGAPVSGVVYNDQRVEIQTDD